MLALIIGSLVILFPFSLSASCLQAPAKFENNRIYIKVPGTKEPLHFYTDSGGGIYPFIYQNTAEKLQMKIERTIRREGMEIGFSTFPNTFTNSNIPLYPDWKGNVRVYAGKEGAQDEPSQIRFFVYDGFLGATFFAAGKIWRFNYPKQELWYCDQLPEVKGFVEVPIFFKEKNGIRDTHQPRMEIEIAGTKLPMLFDTGANSFYSTEVVKQLKLAQQINPSSFIRESVARKLLKQNPSWRVIESGDRFGGGGFLIEIPKLKVAGFEVGPAWFATRKDSIYDNYSITIMDSNIDGAVGGNVFKHFEITADYPSARLYFKRQEN